MSESTEPMGDPDVSDLARKLADRLESGVWSDAGSRGFPRGRIEFDFRAVIAEWVEAQE